jgi:3beta-hydroxy-delta5-steroid dehydrogenase/steroid delta-isomerase
MSSSLEALWAAVTEGLDETVGPRCLVTGGAGYVGRHLCRALLALGCEVRSLDLAPSPEPGVRSLVGDVRSPKDCAAACEGVDTVFHVAAVITLCGLAPGEVAERIHSVNALGTEVLLAAAREAGVGRLVHTSSINVVIDRRLVEVDEVAPYGTAFVDLYSPAKVIAERAALAADTPGGLRTAALRPGGVWGPGDSFMLRTFLQELAAGRFLATVGDGSATADNTHVFSLVRAQLLAARRLGEAPEGVGGRAYFVTDDERVNGMAWFRPVAEGLGYRYPRLWIPGWLGYLAGWTCEAVYALGGPAPSLSRMAALKLSRTASFRIDRAREELGYAPLVDHKAGLALHLEDYRALHDALAGRRRPAALPAPASEAPPAFPGLEKLVFALWEPGGRGRAAVREALTQRAAPALLAAGAERLSMCIADEAADVRGPSPFPLFERRHCALVNVWAAAPEPGALAAALEAEGFEVAGWRVEESVYRDYGGNAHAAPRSWPDGQRSPGVTAVSFLERPGRIPREEWVRRWHSRISPVSEALQPRTRYVRNLLLEPVTAAAPPYEGIVEECFPSPRHVSDPFLFYGASGPISLIRNLLAILAAVSSFLVVWRVRTVMMSEYFLETGESERG